MNLGDIAKKIASQVSNTYLYDQKSKRALPQSFYWQSADMGQANKNYLKGNINRNQLASKHIESGLPVVMGMASGVSPTKRALVDSTGRKVLDQSGFIEQLVKRYESGATKVRPGQTVDFGLDDQARTIYSDIFKKKPQGDTGRIVGLLNEALQGYRTEQMMKANPVMQKVINSFR